MCCRILILIDNIYFQTRALLSLWDPGLVEEALRFVEEHKVQRGTNGCDGSESDAGESPFRRITRQLRWDSPPPSHVHSHEDELATPDSPRCLRQFWQPAPEVTDISESDKKTTDENSNLSNVRF